MTDDQGYGISSTFGGVIPTPTLDRVANAGLRYTEFNSTALCSPTRAALITGRNHHEGGLWRDRGAVDRFSGIRCLHRHGQRHDRQNPQRARLRDVVVRQEPQHAGLPDQHGGPVRSVALWDGLPVLLHTQIFPWLDKPGYNLTTDMADEAVKAEAPGQPFFLYYAPGGSHSPPQPTPEWIEKFRGKFDMGWNAMRDVIFANQKWLGVIPADAELTPWPDSLAKWETLSADEKRLFARQAEVFAAYTAYTDYEIGRVIQEVQDQGKLDNTLIIYICGDNGTSPGGSTLGTPNVYTAYNGVLDDPVAEQLKFYDVWGSVETSPHMAVAWSWAFDTPFKWTKQIASHFGGTGLRLAISWPARIKDIGGIRHPVPPHHRGGMSEPNAGRWPTSKPSRCMRRCGKAKLNFPARALAERCCRKTCCSRRCMAAWNARNARSVLLGATSGDFRRVSAVFCVKGQAKC